MAGVPARTDVPAPTESDSTRATPVELEDFRAHVHEALTEIRTQQASDELRALERRVEAIDATMPQYEEWLGLSGDQSERLRAALLARYDREQDVVRRWQDGEDPEVLGELKRNDWEVHVQEVAGFLTPEQFETYSSKFD